MPINMNLVRNPILNMFYLWQIINHCSYKLPAKTQWMFFPKSFGNYPIALLELVHYSSTLFSHSAGTLTMRPATSKAYVSRRLS